MYVELITKSGGVTDTPTLPSNPELEAVHAMRPGLLLDVQGRYLMHAGDDPATAFAALNLADDTVLTLFDTHRPELQPGDKGLRFGPYIGLVREDDRALNMAGDYTIAWVGRITPGTGGVVVGQQTSADASWAGYDYSTGALTVAHAGLYYALGANELDDGDWHSVLVAFDAARGELSIYTDGVYGATAIGVATGWGAEGRLIVGAIGETAVSAFFGGDLAALTVLPGRCLHSAGELTSRGAVFTWLDQVKTRMTA